MLRKFTLALVSIAIALSACHKRPTAHANPDAVGQPAAQPEGASAEKANPATAPKTAASPKAAAPNPTPVAIDEKAQVIVLGYHRFVEKVRRPDTEITPADFEAQMQQLKDQGITVIPMHDLLAWKRGEKNIPARSAVITLDDGWKSQYEVAWPILKKYGYPFTLFLYTDYVKGGPKSGGESMSWEQLAEMRDAGADIEDHTASHHDLRGKRGGRAQEPDYEAWLWNELDGSKQILEQHLGIKISALALPYGYYNEHVKEVAKKAGYEAIFTVNGVKITYGTPPDAMGRYMIESNKPQIFTAAVNFGGVSSGSAAPVAQITTASLAPQPPDGATISDPKPAIRASLESFGEIEPGSLAMRLSGSGVVDAKYDPATKTLTYQPAIKLRDNTYTVIVSAKAKGKKVEARWAFTVDASSKGGGGAAGGRK
jgi:peptidoglycan/xylan/chitin deacetylase (PgdA/CDA1 family)